MSKTTKALQAQLNAIQQTLKSMQDSSTTDAEKDFATTNIITKRALLENVKTTSMLEKAANGETDDVEGSIDISEIYGLKMPSNRSFMWQWWQRINQECEGGAQSCRLIIDKKTKISIYKLRKIKEGIKFSIMFGSGAIFGNEKMEQYETGYVVESNNGKLKVMPTQFTSTPEINFVSGKWNLKQDDKKVVELEEKDVVLLTIRDSGIGDIVGTQPLLPLQIYADGLINNNASNCITKSIMVVKDGKQSDIECRRFRAPNVPVLRQIADNQTNEPINNIIEKKIGENASKQLLDLIQGKKGIDETYDKFMGKPSTSASQSKVSGEFVAGQANSVYLADYRYERIADAILEFNGKYTEKINIDINSSPLTKFGDLNGTQENNNGEGNNNAVKNATTRETITPENNKEEGEK